MDTLSLPIPIIQRAVIGAALPEIEEQARVRVAAMPPQLLAMLADSGMSPDAIVEALLNVLEAVSDGKEVTINIAGHPAILIEACDMGI